MAIMRTVCSCALLVLAFLAACVQGNTISDPNRRIGNVEFIGQLCFDTGTTVTVQIESERAKQKNGLQVFLFNSKTLDTFFADGMGGKCDFEARQSQNFTLGGVDTAYLDVSAGGNCEGSCTLTVDIVDVPNVQFVVAQCSSTPERVSLAFRITSMDAVVCGDASYALSALPFIIAVCVMVVVDVVMLGVTFLLYRRKVQLEELKI